MSWLARIFAIFLVGHARFQWRLLERTLEKSYNLHSGHGRKPFEQSQAGVAPSCREPAISSIDGSEGQYMAQLRLEAYTTTLFNIIVPIFPMHAEKPGHWIAITRAETHCNPTKRARLIGLGELKTVSTWRKTRTPPKRQHTSRSWSQQQQTRMKQY